MLRESKKDEQKMQVLPNRELLQFTVSEMVVKGKDIKIKRSSHQRPNLFMHGCVVGYLCFDKMYQKLLNRLKNNVSSCKSMYECMSVNFCFAIIHTVRDHTLWLVAHCFKQKPCCSSMVVKAFTSCSGLGAHAIQCFKLLLIFVHFASEQPCSLVFLKVVFRFSEGLLKIFFSLWLLFNLFSVKLFYLAMTI